MNIINHGSINQYYAIDIEITDKTEFIVGDINISPRISAMASSLLDMTGVNATLIGVSCLWVEPGSLYSGWISVTTLRFLYVLNEYQDTQQGDESQQKAD